MRARWMGTLLVVALAGAACGKSEQQKQAEAAAAQAQAATAEAQKQAAAATAQAADATKQATQDMAKGLEAMAQGMAAAGAATRSIVPRREIRRSPGRKETPRAPTSPSRLGRIPHSVWQAGSPARPTATRLSHCDQDRWRAHSTFV